MWWRFTVLRPKNGLFQLSVQKFRYIEFLSETQSWNHKVRFTFDLFWGLQLALYAHPDLRFSFISICFHHPLCSSTCLSTLSLCWTFSFIFSNKFCYLQASDWNVINFQSFFVSTSTGEKVLRPPRSLDTSSATSSPGKRPRETCASPRDVCKILIVGATGLAFSRLTTLARSIYRPTTARWDKLSVTVVHSRLAVFHAPHECCICESV